MRVVVVIGCGRYIVYVQPGTFSGKNEICLKYSRFRPLVTSNDLARGQGSRPTLKSKNICET